MNAFDLKNCVSHEDRIYAWDNRTKSVVEVELFSVSIKEVPEEVLKKLLASANKSVEGGKL